MNPSICLFFELVKIEVNKIVKEKKGDFKYNIKLKEISEKYYIIFSFILLFYNKLNTFPEKNSHDNICVNVCHKISRADPIIDHN